MRRHLSCLRILCCMSLLSQPALVSADSAISVPLEARSTAAAVLEDAQSILDKRQEAIDRAEAAAYAQKAESDADEAALQAAEAEQALTQASLEAEQAAAEAAATATEADEAVHYTAVLREQVEQAAAVAKEAYAAANEVEASLQAEEAEQERRRQARAESAAAAVQSETAPTAVAKQPDVAESEQQIALEDTDELLKQEKEIRTLERLQREGDLALQRNIPTLKEQTDSPAEAGDNNDEDEISVDWAPAAAAYARADELNRIAADADAKSEQAERSADEKTARAEAAASKAAEAKQAVLDARLVAHDAREYASQSKSYAVQTRKEWEQLVYSQEHPKTLHSASAGMNYYHWRDKQGNSGYQFTQPLYFGYWQKDFSYDLSTRSVFSQNNTAGASGRISTLSDTTLTLAKRNEKSKFMVDYNLSVNIPTGKSALSWPERYATMNEDLVEVSQFNNGWQFTPGINVSWKIGQEDMWTIGTNYLVNGSYNPTSDIANDTVSPGNEWGQFLRWQHAGQDWQFVGELSGTRTGLTKVANGENYDTGNDWKYRLTYNRKLVPNQNIMFYYWRENQNTNAIVPSETSNAPVHYLGTMWSKKLDAKRSFRVSLDVMRSSGRRYAGIYNSYDADGNPQYTSIDVDGRTKYTAGLGYDMQINEKSNLSLDLQAFTMKDGESTLGQSPTTYKGVNLFLRYYRTM